MAPSVAELPPRGTKLSDVAEKLEPDAAGKQNNRPTYPFYLLHFDINEKWPPLEVHEHVDPGLRADPAKLHLLTPGVKLEHISPYLGTEISGIQISQLSPEGLDELALYTAERKVLIFRDQDFKDIGPEKQIELVKHFGRLHKHPASGNVKGYPEFTVGFRDGSLDCLRQVLPESRANQTHWHTDISFEKQPAGTTFLWVLEGPPVGGDTLFASQVEAYNRLSPEFRKRLEGLRAVHSSHNQARRSRDCGRPVRREPIETEHPIVRVHPVTGEKALYIDDPTLMRGIVGFKTDESEFLHKFLYDHVSKGADFHIRVRYKPGTVVIWDNRVTAHSGLADYDPAVQRRHIVRLMPQAEVPIPATS